MSYNDYYSHASTSSRANGPMPRQQPDRPIRFVPDVERGADQAERIRGGCCMCFGGSIWVFGMPDGYDEKDVRDAGASNSPPISPGVLTMSSASPPQSQPQSRQQSADDTGRQPGRPNLTKPRGVSFSPSPPRSPHSPHSPSRAHRRIPSTSTGSGATDPTALDPSTHSISDQQTVVGSRQSISSKAPRALWQRWRDRILNRPRGPSEAGEQPQQNVDPSDNFHRQSVNLGWYELPIEWKKSG